MSHNSHWTDDELCAWVVDTEIDESRRGHLDRCAACQARLREIHGTADRLRDATRAEPSPELWTRLHSSFSEMMSRRREGARSRLLPRHSRLLLSARLLLPATAIAAASIVLGFSLGYRFAQLQSNVTTANDHRLSDPLAKAPSLPFTSVAPLEMVFRATMNEEVKVDRDSL